ncbi:MAG: DUF342 domain-containing protein [Spirochaetes bacterium]|nr:DUF342 domain-containing protein [Spirochaetota bacterium]
MKIGDYRYPVDIPVKDLYELAVQGAASPEEWLRLSSCFVSPGCLLLQFKGSIKFKNRSETVEYDEKNFAYKAAVAGYVAYGEDSIEILPFCHINERGTLCRAVVPAKAGTKEVLSASLVRNFAQMAGVKLPILDENLAQAMKAHQAGGGFTVLCEGKDAVNSVPEVVELVYKIQTSIGKTDAMGNIDYKERHFVNNVEADQHIANYHPAIEAFPGRDVFNQVIKPVRETPFTYRMGSGLKLIPEKNQIVSTLQGILNISAENVLSVTQDQTIDGDVDLKSGNIDAVGNLLVKGNVTSGFTVVAKGNITIEGNIEEATVQCGRNLVVRGGITGGDGCTVTAAGTLHCLFIRNGSIKCQGDVEVGQFIMNSSVQSGGAIRAVTERKGKVVGGTLTAKNAIETYEVGNVTGVKTVLIAGVDPEKEKIIQDLGERIKHNNESLVKLKNTVGSQYFENPQAFFKRLPASKIPQVKKIIEAMRSCIEQRKILDQELAVHSLEGSRNRLATITIHHQAFEGLSLQIGSVTSSPKAVASPTAFMVNPATNTIVPTSIASSLKEKAKG